MCGRFAFDEPELFLEYFGFADPKKTLRARYNVAPGQEMPVVNGDRQGRPVLSFMRWGLVPSWSRESTGRNAIINARIESVTEKPAFRQAVQHSRCIIPATGFYEWSRSGTPYFFKHADRKLFFFAGLYDTWHDNHTGTQLQTFAILTTAANATVTDVHERMPVIVPSGLEQEWISPISTVHALDAAQAGIEVLLKSYAVSREVNNLHNDNPTLIYPVPEPPTLPGL